MYKRLCGLLVIMLLAGSVAYYNYSNRENLYDAMIQASSRRHGVEFELIKAVIKKESNFHANQRGAAGEYGLMQIMPIAADEWARLSKRAEFKNYALLKDPEINIDVGTYLLSINLKRWDQYKNAEALALAEYNAGLKTVRTNNWVPKTYDGEVIKLITFPGTQSYVSRILKYKNNYLDSSK
jgi:soluble lytic murein transglycosylase-like protein